MRFPQKQNSNERRRKQEDIDVLKITTMKFYCNTTTTFIIEELDNNFLVEGEVEIV